MISHKSFEPGEDHLPYKKALAGHDFGFGDVREQENDVMETKKGCKKCGKEKTCKPKKEKVSNPAHYNTGRIEVIDAIEDWDLGFNDGNAIKYIARHKHKGDSIQDIEKAIWYLQRHMKNLKKGVIK
jgi:hypothetical protein